MKIIINKLLKKFGYRITKNRSNEDIVFEDQKKLSLPINRDLIIFDVGASVGNTVLKYNALFDQKCKIYAFEPFIESFKTLSSNTQFYENIYPVNIALSNQSGSTTFNINRFPDTNSILDTSEEGISNWGKGLLETVEKIEIPALNIDDYMKANNIQFIDILKMDTQGAEYLVLEGAKNAIRQGKIKLIYMEIIVMPTYKSQKDLDEVFKLMKELGYTLYNLYKSNNNQGQLRFMDGLFIYNS